MLRLRSVELPDSVQRLYRTFTDSRPAAERPAFAVLPPWTQTIPACCWDQLCATTPPCRALRRRRTGGEMLEMKIRIMEWRHVGTTADGGPAVRVRVTPALPKRLPSEWLSTVKDEKNMRSTQHTARWFWYVAP